MTLDKAPLREKLPEWEKILGGYSLPAWDDFPALSLYMDQVIYLLNQYLSPVPMEGEEKLVTSAMINNYVKLKIIPPPIKKRYGRSHLALLLMVCILKLTVNTGEIRKLIPLTLSEEEIKALYAEFTSIFQAEKQRFQAQIQEAAEPILRDGGPDVSRLIFSAASSAALSQTLAQQLLLLYPAPDGQGGK